MSKYSIKNGNPAKIFYLSYPRPISKYKIAQLLHGTKRKINRLNTYDNTLINKMKNDGYFNTYPRNDKRSGTLLLSNAEMLVNEVIKILNKKNIYTSLHEQKTLTNILDTGICRKKIVGIQYEEIKHNIKGIRGSQCYDSLVNELGRVVGYCYSKKL